ncbi:hypothetical protein WA158_006033 [Blastocystis sp. Blastoise]
MSTKKIKLVFDDGESIKFDTTILSKYPSTKLSEFIKINSNGKQKSKRIFIHTKSSSFITILKLLEGSIDQLDEVNTKYLCELCNVITEYFDSVPQILMKNVVEPYKSVFNDICCQDELYIYDIGSKEITDFLSFAKCPVVSITQLNFSSTYLLYTNIIESSSVESAALWDVNIINNISSLSTYIIDTNNYNKDALDIQTNNKNNNQNVSIQKNKKNDILYISKKNIQKNISIDILKQFFQLSFCHSISEIIIKPYFIPTESFQKIPLFLLNGTQFPNVHSLEFQSLSNTEMEKELLISYFHEQTNIYKWLCLSNIHIQHITMNYLDVSNESFLNFVLSNHVTLEIQCLSLKYIGYNIDYAKSLLKLIDKGLLTEINSVELPYLSCDVECVDLVAQLFLTSPFHSITTLTISDNPSMLSIFIKLNETNTFSSLSKLSFYGFSSEETDSYITEFFELFPSQISQQIHSLTFENCTLTKELTHSLVSLFETQSMTHLCTLTFKVDAKTNQTFSDLFSDESLKLASCIQSFSLNSILLSAKGMENLCSRIQTGYLNGIQQLSIRNCYIQNLGMDSLVSTIRKHNLNTLCSLELEDTSISESCFQSFLSSIIPPFSSSSSSCVPHLTYFQASRIIPLFHVFGYLNIQFISNQIHDYIQNHSVSSIDSHDFSYWMKQISLKNQNNENELIQNKFKKSNKSKDKNTLNMLKQRELLLNEDHNAEIDLKNNQMESEQPKKRKLTTKTNNTKRIK